TSRQPRCVRAYATAQPTTPPPTTTTLASAGIVPAIRLPAGNRRLIPRRNAGVRPRLHRTSAVRGKRDTRALLVELLPHAAEPHRSVRPHAPDDVEVDNLGEVLPCRVRDLQRVTLRIRDHRLPGPRRRRR